MEYQRYNGGGLFTDDTVRVLNKRYVQDRESLDMLADSIGRSPRTLRRLFQQLDLDRRKTGPVPRAVTKED